MIMKTTFRLTLKNTKKHSELGCDPLGVSMAVRNFAVSCCSHGFSNVHRTVDDITVARSLFCLHTADRETLCKCAAISLAPKKRKKNFSMFCRARRHAFVYVYARIAVSRFAAFSR
jgi:hypothetical protein